MKNHIGTFLFSRDDRFHEQEILMKGSDCLMKIKLQAFLKYVHFIKEIWDV